MTAKKGGKTSPEGFVSRGEETEDQEKKEQETLEDVISGEKEIVGLLEKVSIIGEKGPVKVTAVFDTGATRTSIDMKVAAKAGLGPITSIVRVKSQTDPKGYIRRPMVRGILEVRGHKFPIEMTLANREEMTHPVLVGRNVIHSHFIVDTEQTHQSHKMEDLRKD